MIPTANPYAFSRSPSQTATYFKCPRQWFLRYAPGQRWRSRQKGAALIQGSVYHEMMRLLLTQLDTKPIDPLDYYWWLWQGVGAQLELDQKVQYPQRESWASYGQRGRKFWGLFVEPVLDVFAASIAPAELPRLGSGAMPSRLVEHELRYHVGWPELCRIDYAGPLWVNSRDDGWGPTLPHVGTRLLRVLLDFKTVKYEKEPTAAEIEPQLVSGQLALQNAGATVDAVGLCAFVVQERNPHIQWLLRPPYDAHELGLFVSDATYADRAICDGQFPMIGRFTGQCDAYSGCEFKPLCFPSLKDQVEKELYREPRAEDGADLGLTLEEFD